MKIIEYTRQKEIDIIIQQITSVSSVHIEDLAKIIADYAIGPLLLVPTEKQLLSAKRYTSVFDDIYPMEAYDIFFDGLLSNGHIAQAELTIFPQETDLDPPTLYLYYQLCNDITYQASNGRIKQKKAGTFVQERAMYIHGLGNRKWWMSSTLEHLLTDRSQSSFQFYSSVSGACAIYDCIHFHYPARDRKDFSIVRLVKRQVK